MTLSGICKTYRWRVCSSEDQTTQVCSSLVGQSTSSVDQGSDTICLDGRTGNRRAPASSRSCGLLGLEEFLLAVRGLSTVVGITEERGQDGGGGGLVEDDAEGNRRGLNRWEVWTSTILLASS
jgi:hypothetical protein